MLHVYLPQTLTWTLQAALSGSESLEVEVYDYEKLRSNRYSSLLPWLRVVESKPRPPSPHRLLGTLTLSLQEVVSRGSQSVNSALKSKKGDVMQVSTGVSVVMS